MLGQYTTIPNILFMDGRLQRSAIIVFGILQSHAGLNGEIYPSYETIAKEGHISRITAIRAVKQLIFYGYVAKTKGTFKNSNKQASNNYYLNPNPRVMKIKNNEDGTFESEFKKEGENWDFSKKSYAKVMQSYAKSSITDDTPREYQNDTPNNNRNEDINQACIDNNINYTIRTHENFPDKKGKQSGVQSSCDETENFNGQDSTKKLTSAFDSNAGLTNCGKILSKNGLRLIQGGKA